MTRYHADRIEHAYRTIDPVFLNSPQFELDAVNEALGLHLTLKVETLNPIRSFKGRGTDFYVSEHLDQSRFVCASAGNFGQGMAVACRKHGRGLVVYAAESANRLKIERMREMGAEVVLDGRDFDAAKAAAKAYAQEQGLPYVEDGREAAVSEGAGTIGLELGRATAQTEYDALLIPVGNGALINGIGSWFKTHHPETKIIGVVAAGAPSMALSWETGEPTATDTMETIADGIGVRVPVPEALDVMREVVDEVLQVSDAQILEAMRFSQQTIGILLEPAGAAGLAAVMQHKDRFATQRLATILCGSNLTSDQIKTWLG